MWSGCGYATKRHPSSRADSASDAEKLAGMFATTAIPARVFAPPSIGARRASTVSVARASANASGDAPSAGASESSQSDDALARGAVGRRAGLAAVTAAAGLATVASRAPPPAFAAAAATLDAVVELTPDNFKSEVEAPGSGRVFVEFYAPWCPFCQRLEPIWNELPSKLAAAGVSTKIARMNVDTYTDYGAAYGVTGFPTLMLFQDGRPVGQKTGLIDMAQAMKYAGVKDAGPLAALAPAPQVSLVLSPAQVDAALDDLGFVRDALEGLPEETRQAAAERLRAVETALAKRAL